MNIYMNKELKIGVPDFHVLKNMKVCNTKTIF